MKALLLNQYLMDYQATAKMSSFLTRLTQSSTLAALILTKLCRVSRAKIPALTRLIQLNSAAAATTHLSAIRALSTFQQVVHRRHHQKFRRQVPQVLVIVLCRPRNP